MINIDDCESQKGTRQQVPIPTKPRSRSVPDVMDTKFAAPLAELLIKYQRLPRGFFWNRYLLALVVGSSVKKDLYCLRMLIFGR